MLYTRVSSFFPYLDPDSLIVCRCAGSCVAPSLWLGAVAGAWELGRTGGPGGGCARGRRPCRARTRTALYFTVRGTRDRRASVVLQAAIPQTDHQKQNRSKGDPEAENTLRSLSGARLYSKCLSPSHIARQLSGTLPHDHSTTRPRHSREASAARAAARPSRPNGARKSVAGVSSQLTSSPSTLHTLVHS